jgi:glyoxylase-like metal-dependent hydrolase (beta-lactamase superfamily II)
VIKVSTFGDITRIDLSRSFFGHGVYWTTAYLVDGVLIDTGCAFTAAEFIKILSKSRIERIINTHSHEDHIGANASLQQRVPDMATFAHPLALPILQDPGRYQPLQLYRKMIWGMPRPSKAQPLENGSIVETEKYHFQVIYSPGHTADHLCLYESNQQWLFTGDLFVGGKDRAIRAGSDIWQIIESLRVIASLPSEVMFPNSARVRHNPGIDLQEKIDYLERMGEKVLKLAERGMGVNEISNELFGGPMWIEVITWGHLSRRNLVLSYLAPPPA